MKKKWNWIDTTILVAVILLVVAFINRDKLMNTGKSIAAPNKKDVVVTVVANELTEDMVTNLEVGDQIFSQNSLQDGFVSEVTVEPLLKSQVGPDGEIKVYEDSEEINVTVKIDATVTFSGPYMDLGGQEVKVGLPFIMKTTEVEFPGTIKHIEVK